MIQKKEFYFVRHGQTDYNVTKKNMDHIDPPLNSTGRLQAQSIEQFVSSLPVKTVCFSPLLRAKETKDLITHNLSIPKYEIMDLRECTLKMWIEMLQLGAFGIHEASEDTLNFIEQVRSGINQALEMPGPVLVVAHGGIHWALTYLLEIADHDLVIDHCIPVHFSLNEEGKWKAKKLS